MNTTRYIAEEMGIVLRNTAFSPNIKDRLDMSTAVTDRNGSLVAQAEHIPVHVGSMSIGVKNIIRKVKDFELKNGDIIMTNDPYISGTHLNDVMMVSPIFFQGTIRGFAASKAHYVDVGGSTPGSLSSSATSLYQEGMIIPPTFIRRNGRLNEELLNVFSENVRTKLYFKGDTQAQSAALKTGVARTRELFEKYGESVEMFWRQSLEYTENYTRNLISNIPEGKYSAQDYIELEERDLILKVLLSAKNGEMIVDFSGTDKQVESPVNAVFGVSVSSVTFALKSSLDPDVPFNYGFLKPVKIIIPKGTVLNPSKPAPVSAGNVETSQRIADVVFRAISNFKEIPAASQGTMNNIMIGSHNWAFYETIGGGSGARPNSDGVSGIQVNMTNTLNTPIEVIERYFPLRVNKYQLRDGSGGPGKFKGGMGIIRELELLEDSQVTVVGERGRHGPWGLRGGGDGKTSEYSVILNGKEKRIWSKTSFSLPKGSILKICTPGGGGYGKSR